MTEQGFTVIGILIGIAILIFIIIRIRTIIGQVIDDTLKRPGLDSKLHWSPTKLTMASAWFSCLFAFFYDLIKHDFNETAFIAMLGVALGAKVTDAYSKKLNPLVQPPKEETKTEDGKES